MSAVQRGLVVLIVYAIVAAVVLAGSSALWRILALPELFLSAVRIGLLGGVPLAIAVAWHYPKIGVAGAVSEGSSRPVVPPGGTRPEV